MNRFITKIYAVCTAVCLMISLLMPMGVFAATDDALSVNEATGKVFIRGAVDEYAEGMSEAYVVITREGYTYTDFASAETIEESKKVTLYMGLVPVSQDGSYEYTFVAEGVKEESAIYLSYNGEVTNINEASSAVTKSLYITEEFEYNPQYTSADLKILYAGQTYEEYLNYGSDTVIFSADDIFVSEDGILECEILNPGNVLPECIIVFTYGDTVKCRSVKKEEFKIGIYVDSVNGSDSNSGFTKSTALKTVDAAEEIYKTYAQTDSANIVLCEGTYPKITMDVNPGEGKTLTYKNAPGDEVVISGMTKLNISDFSPISDLTVRDRLREEIRANVYELDLSEYGITKDDIMGDTTAFYGARDLSMAHLYLNGKPQQISRWPNSGYLDVTFASEATDGTYSVTHSDIANWEQIGEDSYLEGFFNLRSLVYCRCYAQPASTDGDKLVFFNPGVYTKNGWNVDSGRAGKIAVCNIMEEIDVPGEWCVDATNLKLYYYMPDGVDLSDALEIALSEDSLVSGTNVSDITIDGLKITGSRGDLITLSGADRVTIRNCVIENGRYGISFSGRNNIVENNSVRYTKGTAIWLRSGANAETLLKSENVISNNHIYACALCGIPDGAENSVVTLRLSTSTAKIQLIGDVIENNVIHANPYGQGILYEGMDLKIRGNEIYNQLRYMSDAGIIYTGARLNQYGTVIEGNYIHDFSYILNADTSSSTAAIYWDDWHSGQTAVNNIIIGDSRNGSQRGLLSVGMNSTAKDNIVVNVGRGMIVSDRRSSTSFTKDSFLNGVYKSFGSVTDAVNSEHPEILESRDAIDKIIADTQGGEYYPYSGNTVTGNFHVNVANVTSSATAVSRGTVKDNISVSESDLGAIFEAPASHDWAIKASAASAYGVSASLTSLNMDNIGFKADVPGTVNADRSFRMYTPVIYTASAGKRVVLSWEKALFADSYIYEVATDSSFTNVVASGSTLDNCAEITDLADGASYFWRVSAVNSSKELGASYSADGNYGSFTLGAMELNISDVKFYNAQNTRITNLADITTADYMTYTVSNGARYPISYEIIVVVKDENTGKVKYVLSHGEVQDAEAGTGTDYAAVTAPPEYTSGDEICIFFWDGAGTLKPLALKTLIK